MPLFQLVYSVALVAFTSALAGCPSEPIACDMSQTCQWNLNLSSCVSSLPCALELTESSCAKNTWGCNWQMNKCSKLDSYINGPPSNCISLVDVEECAQNIKCTWRNNTCVRRPTLIISLADDLGWYDVGWRNPRSRTPVLNALRSSGVNFDRLYAARFCAPSRGMLLSGLLPWRFGLQTDTNLNPVSSLRCASARQVSLIPKILKQYAGYSTHAFGKWHLGAYRQDVLPTNRGFDSYLGYYSGGILRPHPPNQFWAKRCSCPAAARSAVPFKGTCDLYSGKLDCAFAIDMVNETNGVAIPVNAELFQDSTTDLFLAHRIRELILNVPDEDPLFLYLAWSTPHNPFYSTEDFQMLVNLSSPEFGNDAAMNKFCPLSDRLEYLGMVATLDEANRIVIDALETVNRWRDTIFIFLSDNGGHAPISYKTKQCNMGFNYPLRGSKFSWWEGGIRVVGFITSPNYIDTSKIGTNYQRIVSLVDFRKTLLRASGSTQILSDDDGIDLWHDLSSSSNLTENNRTELALQVWLETDRFVILFNYENSLWKIIHGYPFSGTGSGLVGVPVPSFSDSAILQPMELPRSEVTFPLSSGVGKGFECEPYCLYDVGNDPQELHDQSKKNLGALSHGLSLVKKYTKSGVLVKDTGLCDPGYYGTNSQCTTDENSIRIASSCGAYLSWSDELGNEKAPC